MNTGLIQIRWHLGHLEYRQRLTAEVQPLGVVNGRCFVVIDSWSDWQQVDAVKGDETDARFE